MHTVIRKLSGVLMQPEQAHHAHPAGPVNAFSLHMGAIYRAGKGHIHNPDTIEN